MMYVVHLYARLFNTRHWLTLRRFFFLCSPTQDGKMMFSLEANNLVDEDGNSKQTQMPYFENGWVEENDESEVKSEGGFKLPWQK